MQYLGELAGGLQCLDRAAVRVDNDRIGKYGQERLQATDVVGDFNTQRRAGLRAWRCCRNRRCQA